MFFHVFKYKVKYMLRDKSALFWLILYPILLSTLFYLSFGNIEYTEFERINLAVINSSDTSDVLSVLDKTEMFNIIETDKDTADEKLESSEVSGIADLSGDKPKLQFLNTGINQSMTKYVFDTYIQTTQNVEDIIIKNPEVLKTDFLNNLSIDQKFTKEKGLGTDNANDVVVFFYALLGMAAIMGCTNAINDVNLTQANQSSTAARICSSASKKSICLLANLSATILFHYLSLMLTLVYLGLVLKIDLGGHIGYIILILFIADITGIMIGSVICSLIKKSEGVKTGILITFTLLSSFFSGLMANDIKYIVDKNVPVLKYINPVNLVTDALYSLYYYGVSERYFINLFILSVMTLAFIIINIFVLRRQKYASV